MEPGIQKKPCPPLSNSLRWMFPKIGGKPPKWMVKIMENPIKMDDLGVPLVLETPRYPKKCDGHAGAEPFGTRGEV